MGLCSALTGSCSDDCEIRIIVMKQFWGDRLGIEIASALRDVSAKVYPNKRLTAKIHPDNSYSLSIVRELGFAETGIIAGGDYDGWIEFCRTSSPNT
jgi:RimJ/RimL family protein N-acetyltransferase